MKSRMSIVCGAMGLLVVSCGANAAGVGEPDEQSEEAETTPRSLNEAIQPDEKLASPERPTVKFFAEEGCAGIAGTWRGQVYSDLHGGYYEFTLNLHDAAVGGGALTGNILARSWSGAPEDVAPPEECGNAFHWTVTEEASGQFGSDGKLTFGGERSWNESEHLCGDPVTDYSFDKFDTDVPGATADGVTRISGRVFDDVVWKAPGLPIELTRVACEE
jgi:hypothetical protein